MKSKKIITLVLLVSIITSLFTPIIGIATETDFIGELKLNKEKVTAGDELEVTYYIDYKVDNPIRAFVVDIDFDKDKLSLESGFQAEEIEEYNISEGITDEIISTAKESGKLTYNIATLGKKGIEGYTGLVFTLNFKVKDDADLGECNIKAIIDAVSGADEPYENINPTLTIVEKSDPEPEIKTKLDEIIDEENVTREDIESVIGADTETGKENRKNLGIDEVKWNELSTTEKESIYEALDNADKPFTKEKIIEIIENLFPDLFTKPEVGSNKILFKYEDIKSGKESEINTLSNIIPSDIDALYPGKEYELKVYLSDLLDTEEVIIPMAFDNNIVEITGLSRGKAYNNSWRPAVDSVETNKLVDYQLGTLQQVNGQDSYEIINRDGILYLTIQTTEKNDPSDPGIDIPKYPENGSDLENEFFIIKFKVNDDRDIIGESPKFEVIDKESGKYETFKQFKRYGRALYLTRENQAEEGFDEDWAPVDVYLEAKEFFGKQPIIKDDKKSILIVDNGTDKERKDGERHYFKNELELQARIFELGEAIETDNIEDVVWEIVDGQGNISTIKTGVDKGKVVYIPDGEYTGEVTVVAKIKGEEDILDNFKFYLLDLNIIKPETDKNNEYKADVDEIVELEAEFTGGDGDVVWTVKDENGNDVTSEVLDDPNSKTPEFKTDKPGEYTVTVEDKENPDINDSIIIIVTTEEFYEISGKAILGSKIRRELPEINYTPRENLDEGIQVQLMYRDKDAREIDGKDLIGEEIARTYTKGYSGEDNFELIVSAEKYNLKEISENKELYLRYTRVGNSNGKYRNESYLIMELPLNWETDNYKVSINRPVTLIAGKFSVNNPNSKSTVKDEDLRLIRGLVGLDETDLGELEAYNINEHTGIDGGDYNTVRTNIDRPKFLDTYIVK